MGELGEVGERPPAQWPKACVLRVKRKSLARLGGGFGLRAPAPSERSANTSWTTAKSGWACMCPKFLPACLLSRFKTETCAPPHGCSDISVPLDFEVSCVVGS